jgi:osmotically-inducible protein OsmY
MKTSLISVLIGTLCITQLSGCAPLIFGGMVAGANVIHDRRSTGAYVDDKEIKFKAINLRSESQDISEKTNIDIAVYNQRILLTGQAPNRALAQTFAQQVAEIPRVRHVFNEVEITEEASWTDAVSDTYLTGKVKMALFDIEIEGFDPTRVLVTSSLGSVYLMGLLTQPEIDAVTEKVRHLEGVKRVVRLFEHTQPASQ